MEGTERAPGGIQEGLGSVRFEGRSKRTLLSLSLGPLRPSGGPLGAVLGPSWDPPGSPAETPGAPGGLQEGALLACGPSWDPPGAAVGTRGAVAIGARGKGFGAPRGPRGRASVHAPGCVERGALRRIQKPWGGLWWLRGDVSQWGCRTRPNGCVHALVITLISRSSRHHWRFTGPRRNQIDTAPVSVIPVCWVWALL